jgi:hypothetical protein
VLGHAFGIKNFERVGPGFASVNDKRQFVFVRKLNLCRERDPLDVALGVLVVVVEPGFTYGDDARCVE